MQFGLDKNESGPFWMYCENPVTHTAGSSCSDMFGQSTIVFIWTEISFISHTRLLLNRVDCIGKMVQFI